MDRLISGNSSKAGLPTSFNEINSRIAEASKDSRYTLSQDRKSAELEEKIVKLKEQLAQALKQEGLIKRTRKMVDGLMEEYEREQREEFNKWREFCWICVDMDAFYASVECLDYPEFKNVPMAIGGQSMLSTSNYEARKYGVSAAMPGYIALKLCPELVIRPLRFERYKELSGRVGEILKKYDDNLMMWSLDEAILKLKVHDTLEFPDLVQKIRREINESTGLTCSAGIASNPLLAKLASNYRKPDGQFEINRKSLTEMRSFLFDQPVIKLSGIGKVTSLTLEKVFGIKLIGDLYEKRHFLPLIFKEKTFKSLLCKSIGHNSTTTTTTTHDDNPNEEDGQKSVSCERTFSSSDGSCYEGVFEEICENLSEDVKRMKIKEIGRIGIKLKTTDFRQFTRERKIQLNNFNNFNNFNNNKDDKDILSSKILKPSLELFNEFMSEDNLTEFRLIGIRLSSLKYESTSTKRRLNKTILEEWLHQKVSKNDSGVEEAGVAHCPVCLKRFKDGNDLVNINEHIDECLTKKVLKEIIEQE